MQAETERRRTWFDRRRSQLQSYPVCVVCYEEGHRIVAATRVRDGQSLCEECEAHDDQKGMGNLK